MAQPDRTTSEMAWTLDGLRELLRHMEWADFTMWRALFAHAPAEQDERLRHLLLHMHGVQRHFLAVWTSAPPPSGPAGSWDLKTLGTWLQSYYAELAAAIETFDEGTLARPVRMPGLDPYEEQMGRRFDDPTLGETIVQVAMHSAHHRGQVNARLRELGGEPPLVDFIGWIWLGKPPAGWTGQV